MTDIITIKYKNKTLSYKRYSNTELENQKKLNQNELDKIQENIDLWTSLYSKSDAYNN